MTGVLNELQLKLSEETACFRFICGVNITFFSSDVSFLDCDIDVFDVSVSLDLVPHQLWSSFMEQHDPG